MDLAVITSIPEQLSQITTLLAKQNKQIEIQNMQLAELTKEVDGLKTQIAGDQSEISRKDEIIQNLQLELEKLKPVPLI